MTKYEKLYGVTVDHFPNEKENVKEKLRLARKQYNKIMSEGIESYEDEVALHEAWQAVKWAEKILQDIEE